MTPPEAGASGYDSSAAIATCSSNTTAPNHRIVTHTVRFPSHRWQSRASESTFRNVALIAGRRGGKTSWGSIRFLELALDGPPGLSLITGPDLPTIKQTTTQTILFGQGPRHLGKWPDSVILQHNRSERWFDLVGGNRVYYRGGDNPDDLRGMALKVWWADELALCKPGMLPILRISTMDTKGKGLVTTTPKGRNWFYQDVFAGLTEVEPGHVWQGGEWEVIRYSSRENPGLEDAEVDKIASELSAQMLAQELEAEFVDWAGAVFPASVLDRCFAMPVKHWGHPLPYHPTVFGCDPAGRGKDWRVCCVVCIPCRAVVDIYRARRGPFLPFYEAMGQMAKQWDPHEFWFDETGMGGQMGGEEIEARLRQNARHAAFMPYVFSAKTKAELLLYLEARLEEGLAIPGTKGAPGNMETGPLRAELRAYEWDDADLEQDCVIALALAARALQPITPGGGGSPIRAGGTRASGEMPSREGMPL